MLWEEDLSSEMERDGEEEREIQGDIVRVLAHSINFNSPQTLYRYYINFLTLTKSQSKPLGSTIINITIFNQQKIGQEVIVKRRERT